ncbi:MAG: peptide chain release factor N(5)-glutamine methyltransferase [Chitinophagales bacterium]
MWRVKDLLEWTINYFAGHNITEPRLEAEVLLASALGLERVGLYVEYDRPANEDERAIFRDMVKRRVRGEPSAYITGQKEFMSRPFNVNQSVLIPRPDTEVLVEECIRLLRERSGKKVVADVGTGSGAIAVSLAFYVPETVVYAIDISRPALEIANSNAVLNGVDERIFFEEGDLLAPVSFMKFDLIAANLPYIPSDDISELQVEVSEYEPKIALDGGLDGLAIYRRLLPAAFTNLKKDGYLLIEIGGEEQRIALAALLDQMNINYYVLSDLGGRERVMVAGKGDICRRSI